MISIYLVLEIGEERGREGEREKNIGVWEKQQLVAQILKWGLTWNQNMWPHLELNRQTFALRVDAQPTETWWSGKGYNF